MPFNPTYSPDNGIDSTNPPEKPIDTRTLSGYAYGTKILMRIISGRFKGKRLNSVKASTVRPTSDRVKESVFGILGGSVIDSNFLDLCAGTGNIGLEALSRGAKSVTFVDRSPHCIRVIKSNLSGCGLSGGEPHINIVKLDALKGLAYLARRNARFDLIYLDPPYDSGIHEACLRQIGMSKMLLPSGQVIVERRRERRTDGAAPEAIDELKLKRQERYGDTVISFYQMEDTE